jgi:hypothetical protein
MSEPPARLEAVCDWVTRVEHDLTNARHALTLADEVARSIRCAFILNSVLRSI